MPRLPSRTAVSRDFERLASRINLVVHQASLSSARPAEPHYATVPPAAQQIDV